MLKDRSGHPGDDDFVDVDFDYTFAWNDPSDKNMKCWYPHNHKCSQAFTIETLPTHRQLWGSQRCHNWPSELTRERKGDSLQNNFMIEYQIYDLANLSQALEDKLINIKNIVIKHSESSDFSGKMIQKDFMKRKLQEETFPQHSSVRWETR